MTETQEQHLELVLATAKSLISTKYRKGQAEHGGNLFDKSVGALLDEAINEAIDQLVYLITAKAKLNEFKAYTTNGRPVEAGGFPPGTVQDLPTTKI